MSQMLRVSKNKIKEWLVLDLSQDRFEKYRSTKLKNVVFLLFGPNGRTVIEPASWIQFCREAGTVICVSQL
jgi:hypothetical protein